MKGTIVCDLDGVVYLGETLIPGADQAIERLRSEGWQILFATNNASRAPRDAAAKIARLTGSDVDPDDTISSAQAAAFWMSQHYPGGRAHVLGGNGIYEALSARGIATEGPDPDAVVVGLTMDLSYELIKQAALAVRGGAQLVATNVDPSYPTPEGLWPGAGSLVAAVATAAGAEPVVTGKPHQPMIDLILSRVVGDEVVMIGDRPDTDLAMGIRAGWTTVGVLSGVIDQPGEIPEQWRPEAVLGGLGDLPAWLEARSGTPLQTESGGPLGA